MSDLRPFVRGIKWRADPPEIAEYVRAIPSIENLEYLSLDNPVIFFVGENGTGKSTLLEALAILVGMNPEGGSRDYAFESRPSHSDLHRALQLVRNARRESTEYFLRAETFYNAASWVEGIKPEGYGGASLHERSHGEAFLALAVHRFGPDGLYILDEPESALSPQHQLSFLARMHQLVEARSQFVIATHSPILMGYPNAWIYDFGNEHGIERVAYEDTEHFQLTRDFLNHHERYLQHLFDEE